MELKPHLMNKNLPFTPKTKLADVIHSDYKLIPIIGRFGVEFGFGNKTVAEICSENNINVWFFLEIVNSYHNHDYFPKEQLQNFDVRLILGYLSNTHAYYLNEKVPEIQGYIEGMEQKATGGHIEKIKLLSNFFRDYKIELNDHLTKEDDKIFPYIMALQNAFERNNTPDELIDKIIHEPIERYERNHDNLEIKLSDLKNLIIKFLPPVLCKELCQRLLVELFRLESDLEDHARIEDKVLIPKVKFIEEKLLERSGKQP